ncbi:MAG TPA: MFS transporter [Jatrophihabitantaceae bacterium]|jgi:EmrB/QacA subfamily drug resistance transporter
MTTIRREALAPTGTANPRRWLALAFIALAQLMVVLDVTIVNIALPSAQQDLGASDADRQWVITAYTLAFGSLLLLGGRIADYTGRKRTFLIGVVGFAAASALGGAAVNFGMLLTARAIQGAFGALLAPAALSLLAVNFTEPRERAKAFGIYGAISAGGGAVGLLLGGLLTEYLDWRWCLYVNVLIALIAGLGVNAVLNDSRSPGRARFDLPGVALVTAGLVGIVYGCSQAEPDGWGSATVIGSLIAGAVLLVAFVIVETRVAQPLLPMRILLDRTRGSAYLAVGLTVIGLFGVFLFFTYQMQLVMGYSPVLTGVAFLPMTGAILISAGGIASRLIAKVPPRALMVPGLLIVAAGLFWAAQLHGDSSYASVILPAELLVGFGLGWVMAPAMNYATHGVSSDDAGVASATVNTAQQIGASIGTALLNTIATTATATYLATHRPSPAVHAEALAHGFTRGFTVAGIIAVVAALIVAALMNTPRPQRNAADAEAEADSMPVHIG